MSRGSRPPRLLSFSAEPGHVIRTFRQQILQLDWVGVWRVAEETIFCSWLLGLGMVSYVARIRKLIPAWGISTRHYSSSWWFPPMLSSILLSSSTTPTTNLLALICFFPGLQKCDETLWLTYACVRGLLYTTMPCFKTYINNGIVFLFKMST